MISYIAFLRGINVGGHKKIIMAELRELLETLQLESVKTYIQSGNIVFQSSVSSVTELENMISNVIHNHYQFEVSVLVKKASDIDAIVANCPFSEEEKKKSYFMLAYHHLNPEYIATTQPFIPKDEQVHMTPTCVYFFSEKGYGKAVCNSNVMEKKLKARLTTRNYRTLLKLIELAS